MATVADEIALLRGTKRSTFKDLLTDSSFSRLWRAMLVSSLGDWVGFVAVAALVTKIGGARLGGLAVAGVMMARLLPSVLFGPFAGVFADRFDRRKLMISADLSRAALYASIAFLPGLLAIFAVSFVIECLSLLWSPAKDASLPNLVPPRQLPNANSVGLITTYGTLPIGATVFTILTAAAASIGRAHYLGRHPFFLALWLDSLTFLFSARMIWGLELRRPVRHRTPGESVDAAAYNLHQAWEDAKAGYRFLAEHPLIRTMTLGVVLAFAGVGSVISLGPIFAQQSVNAGPTGFGVLMTAFGLGMGAGLGLMGPFRKVFGQVTLFYGGMLAAAACLFVLAAMPTIYLAAAFAVPIGVGVGLAWVTGYTMIQENVPDEFRGRTFATLTIGARMTLFAALVAFPAISFVIGFHYVTVAGRLFDLSGTRDAMWLGGVVVVLAGALSRRGLKRTRLAQSKPLKLIPRLLKVPERAGVFVAFEGVEGAGKGTQVERARTHLESRGREVLVTREPGGTSFGEKLRDTILDTATGAVDARAEALLFAAARAHHVMTVIRPALAEGKVVLCDRYIDSSVAYQGVARGLGERDVLTLNTWATQGLFPDLTILLHLEAAAGLARAGDELDRIESEDLAFHAKVSEAYLKIADEHPQRFVVVDASQTPDAVADQIGVALDRLFEPKHERSGAT